MSKDLRMYFLVPYNISDIQKGIQAGHDALRYARKFGAGDENAWVWDFVDNHETWIILNGGTTNNSLDRPGTLQQSYRSILEYNIASDTPDEQVDVTTFYEPDLNDAMTSVCFIAEEDSWDYDEYTDFKRFFLDEISVFGRDKRIDSKLGYFALKEKFPKTFEKWTNEVMGGKRNVFLRELLIGKKLA